MHVLMVLLIIIIKIDKLNVNLIILLGLQMENGNGQNMFTQKNITQEVLDTLIVEHGEFGQLKIYQMDYQILVL